MNVTHKRFLLQNIEEDEDDQQMEEIAAEPVIEEVQESNDDGDFFEANQPNEDNESSMGFDDNLTYERQSNEKEETNQTDETTFNAEFADLENANSFPSVYDNSSRFATNDETSNTPVENESNDDAMDNFLGDDGKFQMIDETEEEKSAETIAQSEETKTVDPDATDLDAENISEDELPVPAKPKVQDAEEVSDEELPGPKMAELPADTEVVSEEELPALKKEGKRKHESDYDPSEPTDESDGKKLKTDGTEEKKQKLPDLDKYWKAVKADQEDFNAWTFLLQYVDSENDIEAARDAYDKFLSRYCYCYGYWRKYADYEKKKGSLEKCDEVSKITFLVSYHSFINFRGSIKSIKPISRT